MNATAALNKTAAKEIIVAVPVASCTHALPGHGYPRDAPNMSSRHLRHYCLAALIIIGKCY